MHRLGQERKYGLLKSPPGRRHSKPGAKITRSGKPYKANKDLWLELNAVTAGRSAPITWMKVKAHSGVANNEYVDRLAKQAPTALSRLPTTTQLCANQMRVSVGTS